MRYKRTYPTHKTKLRHIKEGTIGNKEEFLGIKNDIGKILNSVDSLKDNIKEMSHNAEQNNKDEIRRKAKRSKTNL